MELHELARRRRPPGIEPERARRRCERPAGGDARHRRPGRTHSRRTAGPTPSSPVTEFDAVHRQPSRAHDRRSLREIGLVVTDDDREAPGRSAVPPARTLRSRHTVLVLGRVASLMLVAAVLGDRRRRRRCPTRAAFVPLRCRCRSADRCSACSRRPARASWSRCGTAGTAEQPWQPRAWHRALGLVAALLRRSPRSLRATWSSSAAAVRRPPRCCSARRAGGRSSPTAGRWWLAACSCVFDRVPRASRCRPGSWDAGSDMDTLRGSLLDGFAAALTPRTCCGRWSA